MNHFLTVLLFMMYSYSLDLGVVVGYSLYQCLYQVSTSITLCLFNSLNVFPSVDPSLFRLKLKVYQTQISDTGIFGMRDRSTTYISLSYLLSQ